MTFYKDHSPVATDADHPFTPSQRERRVLHVGSGPARRNKLHSVFRMEGWREIRLDIDASVQPNIVADITDMPMVGTQSFDAIWCSHCLEHLDDAGAQAALSEFWRVLRTPGFVLITCPDLQQVARLVAEGREEDVVYTSPAGGIRPLDMMFGFQSAIAAGNQFMRHNTGFSPKRLGNMMRASGFAETRVVPGNSFDLWCVGFKNLGGRQQILRDLQASGLNFEGRGLEISV